MVKKEKNSDGNFTSLIIEASETFNIQTCVLEPPASYLSRTLCLWIQNYGVFPILFCVFGGLSGRCNTKTKHKEISTMQSSPRCLCVFRDPIQSAACSTDQTWAVESVISAPFKASFLWTIRSFWSFLTHTELKCFRLLLLFLTSDLHTFHSHWCCEER